MKCKDCIIWYGAEDDEYGPCMVKHVRGDWRHITFGNYECDELYAGNGELVSNSCNGLGEPDGTCACAANGRK